MKKLLKLFKKRNHKPKQPVTLKDIIGHPRVSRAITPDGSTLDEWNNNYSTFIHNHPDTIALAQQRLKS